MEHVREDILVVIPSPPLENVVPMITQDRIDELQQVKIITKCQGLATQQNEDNNPLCMKIINTIVLFRKELKFIKFNSIIILVFMYVFFLMKYL